MLIGGRRMMLLGVGSILLRNQRKIKSHRARGLWVGIGGRAGRPVFKRPVGYNRRMVRFECR
jgi:hypothetical protein